MQSLVDPELLEFLELLPKTDLSKETLGAVRVALEQQVAANHTVERSDISVEELWVDGHGDAPAIRVVAYRPPVSAAPLPALIHIHGGGFVAGTPEMNDAANLALAEELGCVIFSVDYRLAPETQFPGPLEDCLAVLQWVLGEADQIGIDTSRIGVKGESAGGGLAAALALKARDLGLPPLVCQHLIHPMLDDRTCTLPAPHPFTGEFVWTRASNCFAWSALLGTAPGGAAVSSYAAPARAENLSGLPPCFIAVGALDLFLEENIEFARRLTRAGVPVELHLYPGAFHGFTKSTADVGRAAREAGVAALAKAFRSAPLTNVP